MNVQSVPLDKIDPMLWNSRTQSDEEADKGLQSSLASEGLKEPIKVRAKADGRFLLVFGGRRFAAAKAIGWKEIPAVIEPPGDEKAGQFTLSAMVDNVIENLARKDLTTYEIARALSELRAPGGDTTKGLKLEDIVKKTGLSKGYISNLVVTFQKLNPKIRDVQWQGGHSNAQLSFLRELVQTEDHDKQMVLWNERVKLSSATATEEASDDDDDEDEDEVATGEKKSPPKKSDKFHVETDRFNKLVRALRNKKIPGNALAIQCLKYLVGKQSKVAGVIDDPKEDA